MYIYVCTVELACATPTWISTQTQQRSIKGTTYFWSSHLCTQSQRAWMKKKGIAISVISPAGQEVQEHSVPPPRPRPPKKQLPPTLLNVPAGQGRSGHWKKWKKRQIKSTHKSRSILHTLHTRPPIDSHMSREGTLTP